MPDRPPPIYVRLDEAEFRRLCTGKVVELIAVHGEPVRMILADIGTVRMLKAVCDGAAPKGEAADG